MRLNRVNIFIKIWLLHLVTYYPISIIILITIDLFNYPKIDINDIKKILISPIVGLLGFNEQIPAFIFIPISLMLFILFLMKNKKWFLSFVLSVSISYIIDYIYLLSYHKANFFVLSNVNFNIIIIIIPSLLFSVLINYLFFNSKYKELENFTTVT